MYYYDNSGEDQRESHEGSPVPSEIIQKLGVFSYQINNEDEVDALATERNYKNRDVITISPQALGDVYESKVKAFFDEHLHEDEEIRFVKEGEGYFDVRDKGDEWIRIYMTKGDLIVLPPGIYHRFTTSKSNYIKAMRLFKDDPKWTPLNRPTADDNTYRQQYLSSLA